MAEPQTGQTLDQLMQQGWKPVEAPAPPPPPSSALAEIRMPAGVPARGRGTQLNPDRYFQAIDAATTPLARPTGIDAVDNFTSPVGLASLAIGGAGVARAANGARGGVSAAALAAVKQLGAEAAPQLKYEIAKQTLEHLGLPGPVAMPLAMLISGYRGNGKKVAAPVEPATPARPSVPANAPGTSWAPGAATAGPRTVNDAMAAAVAKAQAEAAAARASSARGASAPVAPTPPSAATTQSPPAPTPPSAPPPAPKMSVSAQMMTQYRELRALGLKDAEMPAYLALVNKGTAPTEALQAIEAQRSSVFAKLPSDAAVKTVVDAKNARTTIAKGGTKPKP